ncbi:MAG: hypothetical protein HY543_07940, partial [Deltaproteobacteria bacterium]|nr:hypothetical protein [Deltaproteobacteria bacterium]
DAEKIAAELHAAMPQPKAKEKLLGTYGLTARKVGPIPFTARTQLLGTDATAEQYREVFALDPARPMPAAPLRVGKKWIVVRLTKLEQPDDAAWQKEATQFTDRLRREQEEGRTRQLLATLTSQAHIRRYLADEE